MSFPPFPGRTSSQLFRERAEEARTMADGFTDAGARDQMLSIAAGYDRMAENIEQHEAFTKNLASAK